MHLDCYHPDANDEDVFRGSASDFVEYLKRPGSHPDPSVGHVAHSILNITIEVDGDTAYGETYVDARTVDSSGVAHRGFARYIDVFERRYGRWRIRHRTMVLEAARPGFDVSIVTPEVTADPICLRSAKPPGRR